MLSPLPATTATSNIRLRDGPDPSQGRLELFLMGAWGTACLRNWTSIDSSVVCRKLGYFGAADTLSGPTSYGNGTGMVLVQEPRCQGKESDLLQCDIAYPLGVTNCTHDEDVWVNCLQKGITHHSKCYGCRANFKVEELICWQKASAISAEMFPYA